MQTTRTDAATDSDVVTVADDADVAVADGDDVADVVDADAYVVGRRRSKSHPEHECKTQRIMGRFLLEKDSRSQPC